MFEYLRIKLLDLLLRNSKSLAGTKGTGEIKDGYHSYDELYDHRLNLTAALVVMDEEGSWQKSRYHHDEDTPIWGGSSFMVFTRLSTGKYFGYHYPIAEWDLFDCEEVPHSYEWDGTTTTPTELLGEYL